MRFNNQTLHKLITTSFYTSHQRKYNAMIIPYSCKVKLLNKAYKTQANATISPYTCMFEKSPKQHFENTTLCDEFVYNLFHV